MVRPLLLLRYNTLTTQHTVCTVIDATDDRFILGLLRGMLPLLFTPTMHNGRRDSANRFAQS